MHIIKLHATDSTNTYLKQLVQAAHINDPTLLVAEAQEKGRGQRGNSWHSVKGQSLTFSIYKQLRGLQAENQFMISMVASLAIAHALSDMGVPNVTIKWPNDILSDRKKVVGILVENILEGGSIKHTIIGVGINVNNPDFPNLPQAGSLMLESGRKYDLEEVLSVVSESMVQKLQELPHTNITVLKEIYENRLFRKDVITVFEDVEEKRFNGRIKGISELGELILETEESMENKFQLKEIKMIY